MPIVEESQKYFTKNPYCPVCCKDLKKSYTNAVIQYMYCYFDNSPYHFFIEFEKSLAFVLELRYKGYKFTFLDDSIKVLNLETRESILVKGAFSFPKSTKDLDNLVSKIKKMQILL